jgi:SAM-dependent methyltransferase/prefoldin subunit 5
MSDTFYRDFEDQHRGSREMVKTRLELYLPFVEPFKTLIRNPSALDLGCGRGEWLELMQQHGFQATGVDLDEGMLLACRERDLNAVQADALDYLKSVGTGSQSVVSAFHVVEHISFEQLRQLIDEAQRILIPGGILILETPNPENLVVGTANFYLDPTHLRPLPAKLLSFVAEHAGFGRVKTLFLQESPALATVQHITLLNVLTGVSPDYSVVAQKKASTSICELFDVPFARKYGISLRDLAERYDEQTINRESEVTDKTGKLHSELDSERQRIAQLMVELKTGQEHQNLLQIHAQSLQNELESSRQNHEALRHSVNSLETTLANERQRTEMLRSELYAAREKGGHLDEAQAQRLQNELESSRQNQDTLRQMVNSLETSLTDERKRTEKLGSELHAARNLGDRLESQSEFLQSELESSRQNHETLRQSVNSLETTLANERQHTEMLRSELHAARNLGDRLESQSEFLQSELESSRQNHETLRQSVNSLETTLANERQRTEQLGSELRVAREQVRMTNNQLAALYGSHSWQATRPLRWMSERIRQFVIRPVGRFILFQPRFSKPVKALLRKYPAFYNAIRNIVLSNPVVELSSPANEVKTKQIIFDARKNRALPVSDHHLNVLIHRINKEKKKNQR